jgi:hypothetical protein
MRTRLAIALLCCVPMAVFAAKTTTLADATQQALEKSQLTFPGSQPFRLKATIAQISDPDSDQHATVEEDSVSDTKWRRVIESPEFSQTLITNGDNVSETDRGDYYPLWISQFITAMTEEVPPSMLDALKTIKSPMEMPEGSVSTACGNLPARVDRWVICFENRGLFESVFRKGYSAEFKDYQKFGGRWIARTIEDDPAPGVVLQAHVIELTPLTQPTDDLFAIVAATPAREQIKRLEVSEDTLKSLVVGSTDIQWPSVGQGLVKGGCGIYVSADRSGKVREVLREGCDNAALEVPLHDQVMKWKLKPASVGGNPVQVEALMGIPFQTTLDTAKSMPLLSEDQARKLASNKDDPIFPADTAPTATVFTMQITVDESGEVIAETGPTPFNLKAGLAIASALKKWSFTPYIKDGNPTAFQAELRFVVP